MDYHLSQFALKYRVKEIRMHYTKGTYRMNECVMEMQKTLAGMSVASLCITTSLGAYLRYRFPGFTEKILIQ